MSFGEIIDLGNGHTARFKYWQTSDERNGMLYGLEYAHIKLNGTECIGLIHFNSPGKTTGWGLICLDPLTVAPSLLCNVCGDHGFIRNGTWVIS